MALDVGPSTIFDERPSLVEPLILELQRLLESRAQEARDLHLYCMMCTSTECIPNHTSIQYTDIVYIDSYIYMYILILYIYLLCMSCCL